MLIEDEEYLAVYFSGPCDDPEDDCALILDELESVDTTMQVEMKYHVSTLHRYTHYDFGFTHPTIIRVDTGHI